MTTKFHKDQRVTFTRAHDRAHVLTGKVVEVTDTEVLVATDPHGVKVWANLADLAVAEPEDKKEKVEEKKKAS